jgi:site-specific DNA-adenine methylase
MARTLPTHKVNYSHFVDPDYARVTQVNSRETAKTFEAFNQERLAEIPDEGAPKDAYKYATHMGAYVRALDDAKENFIKAKLAFYAPRGSGSVTPPPQ